MKRKIAMFASTWFSDYTTGLINGIQDCIHNMDIELHIFNTYDATEKIDIIPKEQDILSLPCLDSYDGVLIVFNSVGSYPEVEKLASHCASIGKPVLCIDQDFGNQPVIGVDNYESFYQVVEHMIAVHDCKVFNYLGGPEIHPENKLRFQAFQDCLKAHNISMDPERILFLNFLHTDGKRAYDAWKAKNLHIPDAVICANDRMALGYCIAAGDDGFRVPDDFKITGFDNMEEAQFYIPSVTSVNRNWRQLGTESMTKLLELMDGTPIQDNIEVKGVLVINESCGCSNTNSLTDAILINYRSQKTRDNLGLWSRKALQAFCSAESETDIYTGLKIAEEKIGLTNLTLCLNHSLIHPTKDSLLDDYMDDFYAISTGFKGVVTKRDLLPENLKSLNAQIYVFSPLHFGAHNFGYCVVPYQENLFQYDKHRKFIDYLCLSLECTTQREMLKVTNKQLESLYLLDQLTGLNNRFGYTDWGPVFFKNHKGQISVFYMDLDNLKQINDLYGHALGDKSLRAIAEGINQTFSKDALKIRMGGDEFLVIENLLSDEEAAVRQQALSQYLSDYQQRENVPITLSASIGYLKNTDADADLEKLIRDADARMYEIKQKKKQKI